MPSWYPSFEAVTIKSELVPLSPDFVRYLTTGNTLFLPPAPDGMTVDGDDPRFASKPAHEVEWEVGDVADHPVTDSVWMVSVMPVVVAARADPPKRCHDGTHRQRRVGVVLTSTKARMRKRRTRRRKRRSARRPS